MEPQTRIIPVDTSDGKSILVQATVLSGEQDIAARTMTFEDVNKAVEEIARNIATTIEKVKPRSASVEFGVALATESGNLTAFLVKGNATASLKITLAWGEV